ncbi:BatA domain-containing protein [Verrucomicrobiaceae bacterium 5K15]|uniref:BatA domain-containing protein n=1 Tax=Oceaniferula flava TaxID=2800421 RepID=A0AAE2VBU0_9BACT|nr:BatA domain-containing protein [Oceaniferula flavus]MBK1854246.1 BatA domain-containing protein [Oceaniferula flavus]MBM1135552.1 BatA domain-containing protein [Oceaniferula flavus]
MNLILTNFHGFWALLGIPAVILIHFLQRRAKVETVSTLFLLKQTQRESTSGRRFDRLVNSVPLWLQILAVLLATWLLLQPRYVKAKSTQRIAIVLDSSASMRVFKDKLPETIQREIPRLQGNAANIEVWLMESDPSKAKIYQGNSTEDLLTALADWSPSAGATEPTNTLRVARSLVGSEGAVSYITDSPLANHAPYNSSTIAIGEPTDNCGFTGVTFESDGPNVIWKAIVRNYSSTEQTCTWKLETATGASSSREITLKAESLTTLQGAFPKDHTRCRLVLSADAFDLDDTLPMVVPSPKPLFVTSTLPKETVFLSDRMLASFPNLKPAPEFAAADLIVTSTETTPTTQHLMVFPQDKASSRPYLTGNIVATKHPLTEGLNWQTLLVRESYSIPHAADDEVLLWQGNRALIYLRTHPNSRKKALIFNFDISRSNGMKQPALAVLMLRYCELLQREKVAPETRLTETGEPLQITHHTGADAAPLVQNIITLAGESLEAREIPTSRNDLSAPEQPGFFILSQGDQALLTSATYFADTREADFSDCATEESPASSMASAVDHHTRDDHLWRIWVCMILAAVFGAWWFTKSGRKESLPETAR